MKFDISLFLGLSFSISVAAGYEPIYLQKRTCSQNNLYRTLERLQRESSFCQALLLPNPTVTVPSSIAATPIATISSACNCIVATLTTSRTTTSVTTSSTSVCANTVTITPNPVTVTERPDPVTVTETYTTTSTPTQATHSHVLDFEKPDRLWGCGSKIEITNRFDVDFSICGEHEDPQYAHSGDWFYRLGFFAGRSEVIFRFGNKKALAILPDVEYEFSIWYRQLSYTKSICSISVALGNRGLPGIGGLGTVNSGFGIGPILRPTASLNWTKSSMRFKTQYTELGMFITAACQCPIGESCGDVYLGFDDITITPVVPV
ncbi:hypothetical protein TWF106_000495 [Orbilia oligospora]|uniref:Uncharacterized protein n=1 Tax=Orbilia oligospora TaxID=2813651 RepID=A0A7C8UA97_ORBOL|nr:hypothetical protein TWF106_000495 [Orbilia oligospora]KAF3218075.1 hypothetical protein TWF679_001485 [Orbilia oligospora]